MRSVTGGPDVGDAQAEVALEQLTQKLRYCCQSGRSSPNDSV